jgi:hypothetical protein
LAVNVFTKTAPHSGRHLHSRSLCTSMWNISHCLVQEDLAHSPQNAAKRTDEPSRSPVCARSSWPPKVEPVERPQRTRAHFLPLSKPTTCVTRMATRRIKLKRPQVFHCQWNGAVGITGLFTTCRGSEQPEYTGKLVQAYMFT